MNDDYELTVASTPGASDQYIRVECSECKEKDARIAELEAKLASERSTNIGILRSFSGINLNLAAAVHEADTFLSQKLARYQTLYDEDEGKP